jgi:hypothetical protein
MIQGTMRLGVKHHGEDNQSYAYNTAWAILLTNTEYLCGEGSEPWSPCRAGGMPALAVHLLELAPYGSLARTSVPAAESIPPIPFTRDILALGTWRGPHSPRSWRVDSIMGKMPYIPEWV